MESATLRFCRTRHSACSCSSRWYSASSAVPYTMLGVGCVLPGKLPEDLCGNEVLELGTLSGPLREIVVHGTATGRTSRSLDSGEQMSPPTGEVLGQRKINRDFPSLAPAWLAIHIGNILKPLGASMMNPTAFHQARCMRSFAAGTRSGRELTGA